MKGRHMNGKSQRKILVLLDSPEIRSEVVRYSVELAVRTGEGIFFLMILRREKVSPEEKIDGQWKNPDSIREAGDGSLNDCVAETRACGVESEVGLRQGDPASELLKFLAGARPYQAVVWGGNEAFLRGRRVPVRGHWLERVRDELDCALVVPTLKGKRA